MKRIVFLLALAVFFVGMGFAKTPETRALNKLSARPSTYGISALVINPPRPHAKFRWLLVIEHTLYPGHIHYLYADKYHIFQEPDGWLWIIPEGQYEAFLADKGEEPRRDTVMPIIFHSILLSYPKILRYTKFLRVNAPKPIIINDFNTLPFNDSKKFMKFWTARAKKVKMTPQKAKVVFKK